MSLTVAKSMEVIFHPITLVIYFIIILIYYNFSYILSSLSNIGIDFNHIPKIEDVQKIAPKLQIYMNENYYSFWFQFTLIYIVLQTCSIPGTSVMNFLAGYLCPLPIAIFIACLNAALGASGSYLVSKVIGGCILRKIKSEKLADFTDFFKKHKDHLFSAIILARVTPLIPNSVINILSPHADIPLWTFFIGTFIGVAPLSLIYVLGGSSLKEYESDTFTLMSPKNIFIMVMSFIFVVLFLLKNWIRQRLKM